MLSSLLATDTTARCLLMFVLHVQAARAGAPDGTDVMEE